MEVKKINNRLRVILAEQVKTNRWLADQMGVSEMTISRWTTNKIQPSIAQFVALSKILNVELKDLLENEI